MSKPDNASHQYTKVPVKDNEKEPVELQLPATFGYGKRHIQLVIFFMCMSISFVARGHLGVTLVAMTSRQHFEHVENDTNFDNYTQHGNVTENSMEDDTIYKVYDWPKPIQEMILSAFFLGYLLMMFPIGFVCQRWGGKVPLQISLLINAVVCILTPWIAFWGGWKAVCVCRVIQGLSQTGTYPGIQTLLSQWVPDSERASLTNFVYSGTTAGNVVGFQLGGLIAAYCGWPVTFWAIGALCLLTFTALTVFGEPTPLTHKTISDEEKTFILGSRSSTTKQRRAPWKAMLTSKPLWGNFATHVGSGVAFVFFLIQVPSYIHYILKIDVKSSGLLTSLPYLSSFVTSLVLAAVSDFFTNRKIVSIKNARRISNTFSQVGIACALIGTSYAQSTGVAVACLVLAMSCQMAIHTGWMVNHIDLSPAYSGTLMSMGSTLMNVFILLLPVLVSNIVVDMSNVNQWRIMIFMVAGFSVACNVVFVLFVSTDVQPWNDPDYTDTEVKSLALETVTEKKKEECAKDKKLTSN